jgi:hypothetical protein
MYISLIPRHDARPDDDSDIDARAWAQIDILARRSQANAPPRRDWPRWLFAWSLVALAILLTVADAVTGEVRIAVSTAAPGIDNAHRAHLESSSESPR